MEKAHRQAPEPVEIVIMPEGKGIESKKESLYFWLQSSLHRVYPQSPVAGGRSLFLQSARNATLSFQACLKNDCYRLVQIECEAVGPAGIDIQVRRVGWVPQQSVTPRTSSEELEGVPYIPGLVPDPLYPEQEATVAFYTNQSFWITLRVRADLEPGTYSVTVTFRSLTFSEEISMTAQIEVHPVVIEPRRNFPITHWWNADCLYDWYKVEPMGDDFLRLARPYLQNMFDHGSNVIYVPLLNIRSEIMERPPQLLEVKETSPGHYEFGWEKVRKFIRLAKEIGFRQFEWTHLWAYSADKSLAASAALPTCVYMERNGKMKPLFESGIGGTGDIFTSYMKQFMPAFKKFLTEEAIIESSLFHVSDEPGDAPEDIESYRKARRLLEEIDPSIKVMDAVFSDKYAEPGLTDYPVPEASGATSYLEKGIPHWVYYCCGPTGPYINRFFDTPLSKIRMQGWIFYKLRTLGFLHWGFNYWYVMNVGYNKKSQEMLDPFADCSAGNGVLYGDPFVVYPGENGPIDSIRWEVFAESMQDYALLQTIGIDPEDELLSQICNYGEFPKTEDWLLEAWEHVLARIPE